VIRLHSSAAFPSARSPIFSPSYSAAEQCQTAVENIVDVLEYTKRHSLLDKVGPFFAFSLWVAGRVALVHSSGIENLINPCINSLVDGLRAMGNQWKVAERYSLLLQRVLDQFHDSGRSSGEDTPRSITTLSDMRKTVCDLDQLISRTSSLQAASKQAIAPAKTPGSGNPEYLDAFDIFNYPRLLAGFEISSIAGGLQRQEDTPAEGDGFGAFSANELNDNTNSDWLTA
jgi:hypothetical protein